MPCLRPNNVYNRKAGHAFLVPCGKCDECLQRRKMSLVFRCEQEKLHGNFKHCYFVTLSYCDKYLPFESYSVRKNGSPVDAISTGESLLNPYDLTQYFKRYRAFSNSQIKYFACGEYGSEEYTKRPHFHIILFTNDDWKTCVRNTELAWSYLVAETLQDRKLRYKQSILQNKPIKRDLRSMLNRELIGRVQVKSVTYKRICYVSKYCNKLLFKDEVVKPFVRVSNGLGACFLDSDTAKLCKSTNRHFTYFQNGLPVAIPRYYTHKLFNSVQMKQFQLLSCLENALPDYIDSRDETAVQAWYEENWKTLQMNIRRARLARYGFRL